LKALDNAIVERFVRSIRVECLDHLIVINDRHLAAVWSEFIRLLQQRSAPSQLGPHQPRSQSVLQGKGR